MATFDATPCLGATLDELELDYILNRYIPSIGSMEVFKGLGPFMLDEEEVRSKLENQPH